jgi:predicted transcriptional regulator
VDEPIDLPDGCEVALTMVEDGDDLDDEDRAHLHDAIRAGQAEMDRGEGMPAAEVVAMLRAKHG